MALNLVASVAEIDETPSRNRGNECYFARDAAIETCRASPKVNENVLDGILGIGVNSKESPRERPDQIAVLLNALLYRAGIPGGHAFQNAVLIVMSHGLSLLHACEAVQRERASDCACRNRVHHSIAVGGHGA